MPTARSSPKGALRRIALTPAVALALWCAVHVVPIGLYNGLLSEWRLTPEFRYAVWCGLLLTTLAEGAAMFVVFGLLKEALGQTRSRLLVLVTCLAVSILAIYPLLLIVSWISYALGLGFFDTNMLLALLDQLNWTRRHMTFYEGATFGLFFGASILVSVLLFLLSPPVRSAVAAVRFLLFAAFCAAGAVALFRKVPEAALSAPELDKFVRMAHFRVGPSFTLLWAPLVFFDHEKVPETELDLARRETLAEYERRAGHSRPERNVLLLVVESMRSDVLGRKIGDAEITPTINRLAREGVSFSPLFAQASESAYAMDAIVSGQFPLKARRRYDFGREVPETPKIHDLMSARFETGHFSSDNLDYRLGSAIVASPRLDVFFHAGASDCGPAVEAAECAKLVTESRLATEKVDDRLTVSLLHRWIDGRTAREETRPFYAMVVYQAPHFPYEQGLSVPTPFAPSAFERSEEKYISFMIYDRRVVEKMRNRYYNSLRFVDGLIAETIEHLRAAGLLERTTIVVTGDHGEFFYEHGKVTHGSSLYNEALLAPLVVWGADPDLAPRERGAPFMQIDIAPTVLRLAGLPDYGGFQGEALFRRDGEEAPPASRPVFALVQGLGEQNSVIVWPLKYHYDRKTGEETLFDIARDPGEASPLSLESATTECLRSTLTAFRNAQLRYFGSKEIYEGFFPPRHAIDPGCAPHLGTQR